MEHQPIDFEKLIAGKIFERRDKDRDRTKDPENKFSPSSAGYCERQMFLTKAGLKKFDVQAFGSMKIGSIIHSWIEQDLVNKGHMEKDVSINIYDSSINPEEIYFEGTYDFFDYHFLYDFKSTSNITYCWDHPSEMHKDQLIVYMAGLGITTGYIVYIDKRNLTTRQHLVEFDQERLYQLFKKANKVYRALKVWKENGKKEIPFEKCGCFFCENEDKKDEGKN